jgi:hypothetical protein
VATPPADYYGRYGNILSPNNHASYPFKLNMPLPGVGEVKVPSKDELNMRVKLESLTTMTDAEIRDELEKWPAFGEMSLVDEGNMLSRIQAFRDYRHRTAVNEAHQLGLLTLNPAQEARFEKEYWDKRLAMDQALAPKLEPMVKAAQQKMNEDLYREFSSPHGLGHPAPKPGPAPRPATATSPSAPIPAPAPTTNAEAGTMSGTMMSQ